MRAPPGSVTRPLMLPRPAWDSAMEPAQTKRIHTERKFRSVLAIAFPLFMNSLPNPKSQRDILSLRRCHASCLSWYRFGSSFSDGHFRTDIFGRTLPDGQLRQVLGE